MWLLYGACCARARRAAPSGPSAPDVLHCQTGKKAKKKSAAKFYALKLTVSFTTPQAPIVHVRPSMATSMTHTPSPQGSSGDAKVDTLSSCAIRTMREVELSSAPAPLSRCRSASPLVAVVSAAQRRLVAMLSPRRRATSATSSSLGVPASMQSSAPSRACGACA
jgi:hypothetical protein